LFTNYKGVVKHARNMPERVEDPKDNHSNDPSWTQEGERQFYDARYEIKETGKR
jgi:hypothetical protein